MFKQKQLIYYLQKVIKVARVDPYMVISFQYLIGKSEAVHV